MTKKKRLLSGKLLALAGGTAIAAASFAAKPPDCWMTGGGSIYDTNGSEIAYTGRTTHGMILHCDTRNPNNLQINWEDNNFHLTSLNSAICPDSAGIEPNPPDALFDTFIGMGEGRLNGTPNATIAFTFTDAGEPGTADTARITIFDSEGFQVLDIEGPLTFGNHQAHSNGY